MNDQSYITVFDHNIQFEFVYHKDEQQLEGWAVGGLYSRRIPFRENVDDISTATDTLIQRIRGLSHEQ